jgi:hypothetical protein
MHQAARIQGGEQPPQRTIRNGRPFLCFVTGMKKCVPHYLTDSEKEAVGYAAKDSGVHTMDPDFWAKRPMSSIAITYAGNDVECIAALYRAMQRRVTDRLLLERVQRRSAEYARVFSERCEEISRSRDRDEIMEELPIVTRAEWKRWLGSSR